MNNICRPGSRRREVDLVDLAVSKSSQVKSLISSRHVFRILRFRNHTISRDVIGLTGENNGLYECIALALVNVIIMYFCAFKT